MSEYVKIEADVQAMNQKSAGAIPSTDPSKKGAVSKPKAKLSDRDEQDESGSVKRRCVSTACIACRKRKSKVRLLTSHAYHRRLTQITVRWSNSQLCRLFICVWNPLRV